MLRPRAPSLRVRALLALSGLLLPHAASGVKQSTILNQRRLLLGRVLHAPADDTVALSDGRSLRREQAIGVDGAFELVCQLNSDVTIEIHLPGEPAPRKFGPFRTKGLGETLDVGTLE